MKIGITCHPSAGGSGILATELGLALAERGHIVHFVTFEPPFRLKEFHANVFKHYVTPIEYPVLRQPLGGLALATRIADIAAEYEIELWHAHYAIPNAASAHVAHNILPEEKRFKIVTTLHGTDITLVGADPSLFRLTKHVIECSDAVTAVSNWLARETEREFDLSKPVQTIYNFVDTQRFRTQTPEECCMAKGDERFVMHISNFRAVKRVTDVVRVFKKIADQVPARLIMVGDGPERLSAVGVAKQLGIDDKIKHLGEQEDIERILPCADLVIQPSEHESFGLVALEAMACEVPVIGTASGGICEVVEHGVTGFLCEVGDIDAMAEYAVQILTHADQARKMGHLARKRACGVFSKPNIVVQYELLYQELTGH